VNWILLGVAGWAAAMAFALAVVSIGKDEDSAARDEEKAVAIRLALSRFRAPDRTLAYSQVDVSYPIAHA
jgi:hypothetical protein